MTRARHLCTAVAVVVAISAALTAPALAMEPMTGEEFDAYVTGRTLMYDTGGDPYGGEDYLPGRQVRWSFLDGHCLEGIWYEQGPNICFVYSDDPQPICWTFYETAEGLTAYLEGDADQVLYETGEADTPLVCLGPDVGV